MQSGEVRSMEQTDKTNGAVKLTSRQLQALKTKNRIYDAAVKKINEVGFSNVSVEDITKAARVAKGSFYVHFQSKEDLVLYSYVRADAAYQKAYEESEGRDFLSRLLDFLRGYYSELEKSGKGLTRALVTCYYAVPDNHCYDKERALVQCLEKIVEQGKAEHKLDPDIVTGRYVEQLLSTLIGNEVLWCFDENGLRINDLIQSSMRTMVNGMIEQYAEKCR